MSEHREHLAQNRTNQQSDDEDAEIKEFNQVTDYDDRSPLREGSVNTDDPFDPHNLAISQFVLSARLYDVLLALLKEANPDVARDILELHSQGMVIGSAPSFNGTFLTDEMNESEEDGD